MGRVLPDSGVLSAARTAMTRWWPVLGAIDGRFKRRRVQDQIPSSGNTLDGAQGACRKCEWQLSNRNNWLATWWSLFGQVVDV